MLLIAIVDDERSDSSALKALVDTGKVFERDEVILWQCRNCGFVYEGKTAPKACPACAHPQAYFEEKKNNY